MSNIIRTDTSDFHAFRMQNEGRSGLSSWLFARVVGDSSKDCAEAYGTNGKFDGIKVNCIGRRPRFVLGLTHFG